MKTTILSLCVCSIGLSLRKGSEGKPNGVPSVVRGERERDDICSTHTNLNTTEIEPSVHRFCNYIHSISILLSSVLYSKRLGHV